MRFWIMYTICFIFDFLPIKYCDFGNVTKINEIKVKLM